MHGKIPILRRLAALALVLALLAGTMIIGGAAASSNGMADAASEASSEATPTPSPEASSEATPTPSPEASPEATSTPTPEASSEATPTPAPEASPEPTPTPTREESPEPTPTPAPSLGSGTGDSASTEEGQEEPAEVQIVMLSEEDYDPGDLSFLQFYPADSDPEDWTLPTGVLCYWLEGWRAYGDYYPVEWDRASLEKDGSGRVEIPGTVILPEGLAFESEETAHITYVLIWGGEDASGEPLAYVDSSLHATLGVTQRETARAELLEQLEAEHAQVRCDTTRGEAFLCGVTWDLSQVDPDTPGTYTVYGKPVLPAPFTLPAAEENVVLPQATITVSEPGKIDLSGAVVQGDPPILTAHWGWPIPVLAEARLEYAKNGGGWQTLSPEKDTINTGLLAYYVPVGEDIFYLGSLTSTELGFNLGELAALGLEDRHYFRIYYDGQYSDILKIALPENWLTDGLPEISVGGDRDMVDRTGGSLPDHSQAPPEPDNVQVPPEPDTSGDVDSDTGLPGKNSGSGDSEEPEDTDDSDDSGNSDALDGSGDSDGDAFPSRGLPSGGEASSAEREAPAGEAIAEESPVPTEEPQPEQQAPAPPPGQSAPPPEQPALPLSIPTDGVRTEGELLPEEPAPPAEAVAEDSREMPGIPPIEASEPVQAQTSPEGAVESPAYITRPDLEVQTGLDASPLEQALEEALEGPNEEIGGTWTSISGERLRRLIELNPDSVLFEKGGVAVSLPTEFLRTLKLEAAELLTVIIERRNLGFFLDLSARGQSQIELPETTVRFPVEGVPQGGGLALRREGTEGIIPAQWDSATSLATAAISATGAYEVVFLEAAEGADQLGPVLPAEPENGGIPLLLTVGILACAAGAGSLWALLRKRGRG